MSDAQIPVALDPDGHPVHIDDAPRHRTNYYRCPECRDFVNPRKGDVRTHHFSHAPGTLKDHSCPLGTQSDVERLMDKYRTSEAEEAEQARRIRVFLGRSYGSVVKAFGILPALEWDDLEDPSKLPEHLDNLSMKSEGVKNSPKPAWFHPREPEVRLDLDPQAEVYRVQIDAEDSLQSLRGSWKATGLEEGDVFIGTPERARRVDVDSSTGPAAKQGDWVFVLLGEEPDEVPDLVDTYPLGSLTALGFEVSDETEKHLRQFTGVEKADKKPFYADVLLPPWANPSSTSPVEGEPGSQALVAIIPPDDTDPEFEIVSVPRHEGQVIEVEKSGPGEPRLVRPQFPEKGSRRMLIHWAARQRLIHLHAREEDGDGTPTWTEDPTLGLRVETVGGDTKLLDPLKGPFSASVDVGDDAPPIKELVEFVGPEGYELDFRLRSVGQNGGSPELERRGVTFDEALSEITYYADEESEGVQFAFDALGTVDIEFGGSRPWMEDISDEEIRERVREMDDLPNKARWPLVREIMGAPPGTPHEEFPNGIKKRVRRAFMNERRERRDHE